MDNKHDQDNSMRPEIYQILELVGLSDYYAEILRIGAVAVDDGHSALEGIEAIDRTIPGVGVHNIYQRTNKWHSEVVTRIEDRGIFRPIQYIQGFITNRSLEWLTRSVVTMSCVHVEYSLKRRLEVDDNRPVSLGVILKFPNAKSLEVDLHDLLSQLNWAVYNKSKHAIERIKLDRHMFSIADSFAIYLTCRVLGYRLLKDMGITTKHGEPVF